MCCDNEVHIMAIFLPPAKAAHMFIMCWKLYFRYYIMHVAFFEPLKYSIVELLTSLLLLQGNLEEKKNIFLALCNQN